MNPASGSTRARVLALASVFAAAAGGALVAARTEAQTPAPRPLEIVSRDGADGGPWTPVASAPSISADGSVIVFGGSGDGPSTVGVRDRRTATTTAVPGASTRNGAVSGDGCLVAYATATPPTTTSTTAPAEPTWQPTVWDRCAGTTAVSLGSPTASLGTPAVSAEGELVVWSTGAGVLAFARTTTGFVALAGPSGLADGSVIGDALDVSDDGSVVVLSAAAPGGASQVYTWRPPAATAPSAATAATLLTSTGGDVPANGDSTDPTVSGDGSLVAFETTSTDLAGGAATPAVVARGADGQFRVVAADATDPDLASGGADVAFVRDGVVRLATSTGSGAPFADVLESLVAAAADPAANPPVDPAPAVSADGSRVAFAGDEGATLTTDPRFATGTHVFLRDRALLQVDALDLGDVAIGASADRSTTVTNAGPVAVVVGVPVATAPFTVVASTCGGALAPAATCQVTVRFAPSAVGPATGTITVADAFDPSRTAAASLRARGVAASTTTTTAPSATSSSTTSTTAPASTPSSTVTTTTIPRSYTTWPLPTYRPTYRPSTTYPGSYRPGSYPGSSGSPAGVSTLSFSPPLVVLDPVIAGTGRATSVVSLTNVGTEAATVLDVALDPSSGAGFVVDAATCLGAFLAPGSACQVAIEFTSPTVGEVTGLLVATADDGGAATVEVQASAVEPPTLTVEPDVAAPGQVVTVTGAGFPVGEPLTLWWGSDAVAVTADAAGAFRIPLVVMRHTSGGPSTVRVDGSPERYPTTETTLLVRAAGSRTASPAVRPSVGSPIGG